MISGMIPALVTPFDGSGAVDYVALERLCALHLEAKSDGLVILGTTGEGITLAPAEQYEIIRFVIGMCGDEVPVIVNMGTASTRESVSRAEFAKAAGAQAVMAIVPYYNLPTEEGIFLHFQEIAHVGMPALLYHHPGRTGRKLSLSTLVEILSLPGFYGIKDASGDLDLMRQLLAKKPKTVLLAGDDRALEGMVDIGAKGIVSVVGNAFPREWKEYVRGLVRGSKVKHPFPDLLKVISMLPNPQGIKYLMSVKGLLDLIYRLPLTPPSLQEQEEVKEAYKQMGL